MSNPIERNALHLFQEFEHLGFTVAVFSIHFENERVAPTTLWLVETNHPNDPGQQCLYLTLQDALDGGRKLIEFLVDDGA